MLGPAVGRFGQRILHVPVAGIEKVAAAVIDATAHLGKPPDDRPFSGHVTLARRTRTAKADLRSITGAPVDARWEVKSVCLVESGCHLREPATRCWRSPLSGQPR